MFPCYDVVIYAYGVGGDLVWYDDFSNIIQDDFCGTHTNLRFPSAGKATLDE